MPKKSGIAAKLIVQAAQKADIRELTKLLKQGADMNASHRGYRPLHALIQEEGAHTDPKAPDPKRLECMQWLLANGADPELLGAWPAARAVLVAAFQGQPAYVDALKNGGARIDGFVYAALGDLTRVNRTIAKDPDFPNARDGGPGGLTALQCAAASRMAPAKTFEVARRLVEAGADIRATARSWSHDIDALYLSTGSGQFRIFELLLDHGADPTAALTPVLWKRFYPWADLALARGGDLNRAFDDSKPLLNQLIRWGQIEPALWMLSHGATPNRTDERGWTAVHQAASRGNVKILQAVLDSGGDAQARDLEQRTPWDVAEEMGQRKTMALLPTRR